MLVGAGELTLGSRGLKSGQCYAESFPAAGPTCPLGQAVPARLAKACPQTMSVFYLDR